MRGRIGRLFLVAVFVFVGLGFCSGQANTTGIENIANGDEALYNTTTDHHNIAIAYIQPENFSNTSNGYQALYSITTGNNDTANGYQALFRNTTGNNNTAIGRSSGYNNQTGSSNVFLGNEAGFYETGSNKLYIANSRNNTLIYGDFSNGNVGIGTASPSQKLQISGGAIKMDDSYGIFWGGTDVAIYGNQASGYLRLKTASADAMTINSSGYVGIGTTSPSYKLHVNGTAAGTSWTNLSSREYKENIKKVETSKQDEMLSQLMKVNLSTYNYKEEYGDDRSTKLGFIAEEMPKEVLSKDGKGVDVYELLTYTIGAMKAQQEMIKSHQDEIKEQQEMVKAQQKKIESLEARISEL